jgi:hypothetical protein
MEVVTRQVLREDEVVVVEGRRQRRALRSHAPFVHRGITAHR